MKNLKTIEDVHLGIDNKSILFQIPSGMGGREFEEFKNRNHEEIEEFKKINNLRAHHGRISKRRKR